jgi:hypothetical protein
VVGAMARGSSIDCSKRGFVQKSSSIREKLVNLLSGKAKRGKAACIITSSRTNVPLLECQRYVS